MYKLYVLFVWMLQNWHTLLCTIKYWTDGTSNHNAPWETVRPEKYCRRAVIWELLRFSFKGFCLNYRHVRSGTAPWDLFTVQGFEWPWNCTIACHQASTWDHEKNKSSCSSSRDFMQNEPMSQWKCTSKKSKLPHVNRQNQLLSREDVGPKFYHP